MVKNGKKWRSGCFCQWAALVLFLASDAKISLYANTLALRQKT